MKSEVQYFSIQNQIWGGTHKNKFKIFKIEYGETKYNFVFTNFMTTYLFAHVQWKLR